MRFLHRWNGAILFRGVLQIRSVNELAPAAEHVPNVIVFADGPMESDHWAYAPDAHGEAIFGRWTGTLFEPLHDDFESWLSATIQILDNNIRDPEARFKTRLEADPNSGFLLLQLAERLLTNGKTDAAIERLRQATAAHPSMMGAWERLGTALLSSDQGQARWALLKAFRGARLPQVIPTVFQPSSNLVTTLASLFPKGDAAWER